MKRTISKVLAILLCLAFACALLAGCGKKEKYFVIGGTGPLTGENSHYGLSVKNGAEIAIEEINEKGGINGVKFKLVMQDDVADPANVNAQYDILLKNGMHASIGSVTSGAAKQFAARAAADNVFFMTPSASNEEVIEKDNAYRICFGDEDQGTLAANRLKETYTKIGAIYNSDDPYSKGLFEAAEAVLKNAEGVTFTAKSFTSTAKENFETQVTGLKNAGCEVILLPIYYQEAALIIKETQKQDYTVDFFGCDGLDGLAGFVENDTAIKSVLSKVSYITPFDNSSADTKIASFVEKYKNKFNAVPDQFAADGYDAVMSIYEAMLKIDNLDVSIKASDLCDKLKAVVNGEFQYKGLTGDMTWSSDGKPVKSLQIITLK